MIEHVTVQSKTMLYFAIGYLCQCHIGWMSIGTGRGPFGCVDVDECTLKLHSCHTIPVSKNGFPVISSICTNTMGSYKCACTDGWQGNGRVCDNIDECRVANIDCHFNAKCVDKEGFYECVCDPGQGWTDGQDCLSVIDRVRASLKQAMLVRVNTVLISTNANQIRTTVIITNHVSIFLVVSDANVPKDFQVMCLPR